jgi:hypothetical protein
MDSGDLQMPVMIMSRIVVTHQIKKGGLLKEAAPKPKLTAYEKNIA